MEIFTSHAFYLMMSILILVVYNTDAVDPQCAIVPSEQHTETVDTRHEGCYDIVDENPYIRLTEKDSNIDIEACIEMCYTDGFAFTGRRWGVCYCWSVIGFMKREDSMCISRCLNRGECLPCGSPLRETYPAVLASIYRTEPQDSRFIGCYDARQGTTDQVYALPWWPFESRSDLTVDICIDACKTKLFKYAGLAVKYCFCGNREYDYFGKSSLGCNSKCSGPISQVCGSLSSKDAQYISVYHTVLTPDDDRYLGCFSSIDVQIQDENEDINVNIMTIDICISRCHKMNKHAALKAGSECYCSDFTASQPVPSYNGLCDTPCPGNASQTCGDNSNYAVYKPVCRPGTFGSGCEGQCHCLNEAVCDVKDGKCPNDECAPKWSGENCQDCAAGLFDPNCEGQCHCLNQEVCNGANGMCPGKCAEGWTGSNCQEKCAAGFFGLNCEGQCHCSNQDACDSTNGMCPDGKCAPQWTGTDCQECAAGFFGPNCERQCHCLNHVVCDSTNGMCPDDECAPQWTGTDCQECVAGFFGPKCEGQCHCLNQEACDSTNGNCPGNCTEGWTDSNCQQNTKPSASSTVIGVILACLSLIIMAGASAVVFFRYRKKRKTQEEATLQANYVNSPVPSANKQYMNFQVDAQKVEEGIYEEPEDIRIGNGPYETLEDDLKANKGCYETLSPEMNPLKTKEISDYISKENRKQQPFQKQFKSIPCGLTAKCEAGYHRSNITVKNRSKNIVAYDHNRVKVSNASGRDCINASYIQNYLKQTAFIATQCPTSETVMDFWQMIWEQNTPNIVLLNVMGGTKRSYEKYWPDFNADVTYGDINVTLKEVEEWPNYIIRVFAIKNITTKEIHSVKQFNFTKWPDNDVPNYTTPFLNFLRKVKSHLALQVGPTVVHCSDGVSQTGIFLALDYLLDQAESEGFVDVAYCVNLLRMARVNMVSTLEQFRFLYSALSEAMEMGETYIPCSKLKNIHGQLSRPNPATGTTMLQSQFKMLHFLKLKSSQELFSIASSDVNFNRNRSPDILPANSHHFWNQIESKQTTNGDYINAVFVNGYREKKSFLVTELPLENTQKAFWKMVQHSNCHVIVLLNNLEDTPEDKYWPDVGKTLMAGSYRITCTDASEEEGIDIYHLAIKFDKHTSKSLTLYHCDIDLSTKTKAEENKNHLLTLARLVKNIKQQQPVMSPSIVQCLYGAERSGVFCAVCCMIDMMNEELALDVFRIVQHIRTTRPQFIADIDQFCYLYKVALEYLSQSHQYENF